MDFSEYEKKLLHTKPRFLSDKEKIIRKKCKRKIEYQKNIEKEKQYYRQNKDYYKAYRNANKQIKKKEEALIRVIMVSIV